MSTLQIVIPMAGRGSRFAQAGFTTPKSLIPVGGRPMIEWVIENICPRRLRHGIALTHIFPRAASRRFLHDTALQPLISQ